VAAITSLTHLDLSANRFEGTLEAWAGAMNTAFNSFAHLNISLNRLVGPLPTALQTLAIFDRTNPLLDPYTG
jgi:hypothetical protein